MSNQTLEKLKIQREKLNVRIQKQEAQLKTSERKRETRRKILDDIKSKMDTFLKRNSDRLLFDLPLLVEG